MEPGLTLVEVTIEKIARNGAGVGYDDERNVYFIPRTVPGDRVRAQVANQNRRYRDASLVEILEPSSERQDPQCEYFQDCGGCDWLHWKYESQVQAKENWVRHVLDRGDLEPQQFLPILAADEPLYYRNRIQVRRDGDQVGFYKRQSHDIVNVEKCIVADPKLSAAISQIRKEPSDEKEKWELSLSPQREVLFSKNSPHAAGGFGQVHSGQNAKLKQVVSSWIKQAGASRVLELFCGDANLTVSYRSSVSAILGVDSHPQAIARANELESLPGLEETYIEAQVGSGLWRALPDAWHEGYDTLVLDPPRSGVARKGASWNLRNLIHPKLRNIIYVSCAPVPFSQEVQCLKSKYDLILLQPIDMFPQTKHAELVAWFKLRA